MAEGAPVPGGSPGRKETETEKAVRSGKTVEKKNVVYQPANKPIPPGARGVVSQDPGIVSYYKK